MKKDYDQMYWDDESKEWRYEGHTAASTALVPYVESQSLVDKQGISLEAKKALEYDRKQSVLEAKVEGWKFRSKAKAIDRNFQTAIRVVNRQREFVEAVSELERVKIDTQTSFERDEKESLRKEVEYQKLRTDLLRQKAEQAELLKKIKDSQRVERGNSQEKSHEPSVPSFEEKLDEEKARVLGELEEQLEILERTIEIRPRLEQKVRKVYSDRTEEEIEEMVDKLIDKMLTEMGLLPE